MSWLPGALHLALDLRPRRRDLHHFVPIHFGSEDWPSVRILCAVFMLVFGLSGGTQKASRVS